MKIELLGKEYTITTQSITLGYILLICIGYIFKSLYYGQFDIQIENYLNVQEYLFIFLPISAQLLSFMFFIITMTFGLIGIFEFFFSKELSTHKNKKTQKIEPKLQEELHPVKKKWYTKILYNFKVIILYSLCSVAIMFWYYSQYTDELSWKIVFYFGIFWIMLMSILGLAALFSSRSFKTTIRPMLVSGILTLLIFAIIFQEINRASQIYYGQPIKEVQFELNGEQIITTKNILYIGETRDYLFMRDIKLKTNHIYQKKEINVLEITKIEVVEPTEKVEPIKKKLNNLKRFN